MITPRPRGVVSPSCYRPLPHTPKSLRRELRREAMPRDKGFGAANRVGPVNCFGKRRPNTPLEAAKVFAQVRGLKPPKSVTHLQMITKLAEVFNGMSKRLLTVASGWVNVKAPSIRQSVKRTRTITKAKPVVVRSQPTFTSKAAKDTAKGPTRRERR